MMRVDYRWLRMVSVPLYILVAIGPAGPRLRALGLRRPVGGSARWLQIGPLPAIHPAEFGQAGPRRLPRPLAGQARAERISSVLARHRPVPAASSCRSSSWSSRSPTWARPAVLALTALLMLFCRRRQPVATSRCCCRRWASAGWPCVIMAPRLPARADHGPSWIPGRTRSGAGYHTIQGLLALGLGGLFGAGLGQSQHGRRRSPCPTPATTSSSPSSARSSGWSAACIVIALFLILAYQGVRIALAAPDTFGGLLAAGITAWLCVQAFINIGVVVALLPDHRHHPAVHQRRRLVARRSASPPSVSCCPSRAKPRERGTWNDAVC